MRHPRLERDTPQQCSPLRTFEVNLVHWLTGSKMTSSLVSLACLVASLVGADARNCEAAGPQPPIESYLTYLPQDLQRVHVALEVGVSRSVILRLSAELDSLRSRGRSHSSDYSQRLDLLVLSRLKSDENLSDDDVRLAREAYHLGQETVPVADVRRALGAFNLGAVLVARGEHLEGLEYLRESLELRLADEEASPHAIGASWMGIANAFNILGMRSAALRAYERSIAAHESGSEPDSYYLIAPRWNAASMHLQMGHYDFGFELQARVHARLTAVPTTSPSRLARASYELAEAAYLAGLDAGAQALFDEAIRQLTDLGPAWAETLGFAHNSASGFEFANRRLEPARYHAEQAMLAARRFDPRGIRPAAYLVNLASIEFQSGNCAAALDSLERVAQRLGEVPFALWQKAWWINAQAVIESACGDPDRALDLALAADRLSRDLARSELALLREVEAYLATTQRRVPIGTAISVLLDRERVTRSDVARVWGAVAGSRSATTEILRLRALGLVQRQDETVSALLDRLTAMRVEFGKMTLRGESLRTREAEERLRKDLFAVERELLLNDVELQDWTFRTNESDTRVELADVLDATPREGGLISFTRFDRVVQPSEEHDRRAELRVWSGGNLGTLVNPAFVIPSYVAFVRPPASNEIRLIDLGPAQPIDDAVRAWRRAVSLASAPGVADAGSGSELSTASRELRRIVWDPISADFHGATQVFVIADGTLNFVNFDALEEDDGRFLAESAPPLHYLTSERALVEIEQRSRLHAPRSALIVAGPTFAPALAIQQGGAERLRGAIAEMRSAAAGDTGLRELGRDDEFHPLPGARLEGLGLARLWGERLGEDAAVTLLTGAAASEARFVREAPRHTVVHLATHAFFHSARRGSWASILDPPSSAGIALAHASTEEGGGDDGLLFAEEICRLDLSETEWVVLSACETGLGDAEPGEGVRGLRDAFEEAGARTLILSLWKVQDECTREWMMTLYGARLAGASTVDAIRNANLEVIERRRERGESTSPYFWGAFVATGDWR